MKSTKQIVGVGLLTLVGTSFAMAQTPVSSSSNYLWSNSKSGIQRIWKSDDNGEHRGKHKGHGKRGKHANNVMHTNKRLAHEAILAGDFTKFKAVASTTPIGKIDQTTFNNLSAQMKIIQAARTQVDTILKTAGIEHPFKNN